MRQKNGDRNMAFMRWGQPVALCTAAGSNTFKGVTLPSGTPITPYPEARFHFADLYTPAGNVTHFGPRSQWRISNAEFRIDSASEP